MSTELDGEVVADVVVGEGGGEILPDPTEQPGISPVSAEDVEAGLREVYGTDGTGEDTPVVDTTLPLGDDDSTTDEVVEEVVEEQEEEPTYEIAPGRIITRTQALAYAEFDEILAKNPGLVEGIARYLNSDVPTTMQPSGNPSGVGDGIGSGASVPPAPDVLNTPTPSVTPSKLTPPDDLDLDDPTIRSLWSVIESLDAKVQSQVSNLSTGVLQHDQLIRTRMRDEHMAATEAAVASFATSKSLNAEEANHVRQVASRLQVLPALLSGTDPVTGETIPRDAHTAITRALEIAYNQIPAYHTRDLIAQQEQTAADTSRKRKLAAISGNSGSSPRTQNIPKNPSERRDAMIAEVTAMTAANGS